MGSRKELAGQGSSGISLRDLSIYRRPAETVAATIGVFRLVVPAQARKVDMIQLAAAYVTQDVAGVQRALFKANANLRLQRKTPEAINGGQLWSYAEPIDVADDRGDSTKFIRAWVFFPREYTTSGALFLLLGREQSEFLEARPAELEIAKGLIGGIHEASSPGGR